MSVSDKVSELETTIAVYETAFAGIMAIIFDVIREDNPELFKKLKKELKKKLKT